MDPARPDRWTSARRDVLAALAVSTAFVAVAFLTPPTIFEGPDAVRLHFPNRVHLARRLASFDLPLWNPHVGLGRPFLADIEVGAFYPPHLVSLILDPFTALALLAILHGAVALLGMRALCGHLGAAPWAAWGAGAAFLAAAPVVEWMHSGQAPYTWGICLLPLCFLFAARLQDAPSARNGAALALALALQLLAGHPQIAWITWLGIGSFLAGRAIGPSVADARALMRTVAFFGLAIAGALALAAVQLLPFLELVSQGNRSPSASFASAGAMKPFAWASLLGPPAVFHRFLLYVGAAPLLAGLCGLAEVRDRDRRGLAFAALGGCLVAAGEGTPLFGLLSRVVPGLGLFRGHARASVLLCFVLVAAAGLWIGARRPWRATSRSLAVATVVVLAGVWWTRGGPLFAPAGFTGTVLRIAMAAVAAALIAFVVARDRERPPTVARALLALLVLADLGWATHRFKALLPPADDLRAEASVVRAVHAARLFDPSGVPPRISVPYWVIRDNGGLLYGYSTFTGYVALTLDRVWTYLHEASGIPPSDTDNTYPSHLIYARGPFPYRTMNLRLGHDPATGALVADPSPDPRAWVVGATRRVADWREAIALLKDGHDPHSSALVEDVIDVAGGWRGGDARIVRFEPERIEIVARSSGDGVLVLAEAWYPGWSAKVDGSPRPVVPANAWMRAVAIPAGESRVVFTYRSRLLPWGAAVSLAAVVAAFVLLRRRAASS